MRTIATLIFPEFELLDVFGPLEMFGRFEQEFDLRMVAETPDPIASKQGPQSVVDELIGADAVYDILLIPGGMGTRREVNNKALLGWLSRASERAELTTSVCTGSALLARAGVLDGRRATTNKRAFDWVAAQGPDTDWRPRARWVEDGDVFTSSGVSAGIDMSLAIIRRLLGEEAAATAAGETEYIANRDPDHDPFAVRDKGPSR